MSRFFEQDPNSGAFLRMLPFEPSAVDLPRCPTCRQPLTGVSRYQRVFNKALLDFATRRFIINAQHQMSITRASLASMSGEVQATGSLALGKVKKLLQQKVKALEDFAGRVSNETPLASVNNAMIAALKRQSTGEPLPLQLLAPTSADITVQLDAAELLVRGYTLGLLLYRRVGLGSDVPTTGLRDAVNLLFERCESELQHALTLCRTNRYTARETEMTLWHQRARLAFVQALVRVSQRPDGSDLKARLLELLDLVEASVATMDASDVQTECRLLRKQVVVQGLSPDELQMIMRALPDAQDRGWNSQGTCGKIMENCLPK
jgi:hypothetical protein